MEFETPQFCVEESIFITLSIVVYNDDKNVNLITHNILLQNSRSMSRRQNVFRVFCDGLLQFENIQ